MQPIRLTYITPEREPGTARGKRRAFAQLKALKLIEDVQVISPLVRGEYSERDAEIRREMRDFKPSVVFLEHPSRGMISLQTLHAIKNLESKLIVYEMDIYDRYRKRYPQELREAARLSDALFTPGASSQFEDYRRFGARHIYWQPSSFNPTDFGRRPIRGDRELDVVMIASDSSSRIPGWSIPGSRRRVRLVKELRAEFGDRFQLYGSGWSQSQSTGPIGFVEQEAVLQRARVSVNFDHYPREARSFSNRLPIAMASGSIHITSSHPDYESVFGPSTAAYLQHAQTVTQIVEKVSAKLSQLDKTSLVALGEQAREFAFANFREDDLLVSALEKARLTLDTRSTKHAWGIPVSPDIDI